MPQGRGVGCQRNFANHVARLGGDHAATQDLAEKMGIKTGLQRDPHTTGVSSSF